MEKRDYYPILESILFTMGKSVEIKTLAEALKLTQEEIKQILQDMAKEYSEKQRGIQLVFLEDSVQLCTKPQYYEYLIRIASRPQKQVLSDSVLETLSIVAYKQPVTRGEIERIRGVKSDHAIAKLMGVSQGTVSNMIKEFELQTKIRNLQKDLDDARAIIEKQNLLPQNEDYFC